MPARNMAVNMPQYIATAAAPSELPVWVAPPVQRLGHCFEPSQLAYSFYGIVRRLSPLEHGLDQHDAPLHDVACEIRAHLGKCSTHYDAETRGR